MLIELGTDRLYNLKTRTFKTVHGTVAGLLGLAGAYGIAPEVNAESLSKPPPKVVDYSPRYSLEPYTQCGGEGYTDYETILVTYQNDETVTTESLGIIPGECGNSEDQTNPELTLQPESQSVPTSVSLPAPTATPVTIIFPRYPQIPLPTPNPAITKRPEIKGDQECLNGVNSSLDFLKEKTNEEYNFVIRYTQIIECTDKDYATVIDKPPTIWLPRVSLKDNRGSRASILVHEACHLWQVKRFRERYPLISPLPVGVGHGSEAEAECYTVEYFFLKKVGTNQETLDSFSDWVYQRIKIRIPLQ